MAVVYNLIIWWINFKFILDISYVCVCNNWHIWCIPVERLISEAMLVLSFDIKWYLVRFHIPQMILRKQNEIDSKSIEDDPITKISFESESD